MFLNTLSYLHNKEGERIVFSITFFVKVLRLNPNCSKTSIELKELFNFFYFW